LWRHNERSKIDSRRCVLVKATRLRFRAGCHHRRDAPDREPPPILVASKLPEITMLLIADRAFVGDFGAIPQRLNRELWKIERDRASPKKGISKPWAYPNQFSHLVLVINIVM